MNNWSPALYRTISARYCFMVYIVTLSYASDKVVHVVKLYLTGYSLSSGLGAFMYRFALINLELFSNYVPSIKMVARCQIVYSCLLILWL